MTAEALIENGFAIVEDGSWLLPPAQPAATLGTSRALPLPKGKASWFRRLIAPDRQRLVHVELKGKMYCADRTRPFLSRLDAGEPLNLVTAKLLVAPADSRTMGILVRPIPFSIRGAICATALTGGWAVAATAGRVARVVVADGETLAVRPEALVAWTGRPPTGMVPRLRLRDILLPRTPQSLVLDFHGPCIVWLEGSEAPKRRVPRPVSPVY